jgi:hypothetical protein
MKFLFFSILFIVGSTTISSAQNNSNIYQRIVVDSARKNAATEAAINNPVLRQIHISTDLISDGDIESKLLGQPLFTGKASTIRTSAIFTIPVKTWGKNSLVATGSYFAQQLRISEIRDANGVLSNNEIEYNNFALGLTASFQRRDVLFGKPVFYIANVSGLTNEASSIKKLSFMGSAILMLKYTPVTRFSAGLILNIDPSLNVPVIPIVSYWHKFHNKIELSVGVPTGLALRRAMTNNLWLNLGTTVSGSVAFLDLDYPNIPRDVNYTTLDLKNGLGLEYRLAKKFMVGVNGGILMPLNARAFELNKSSKDYFLDNKLAKTPYINFTFSVLPFL